MAKFTNPSVILCSACTYFYESWHLMTKMFIQFESKKYCQIFSMKLCLWGSFVLFLFMEKRFIMSCFVSCAYRMLSLVSFWPSSTRAQALAVCQIAETVTKWMIMVHESDSWLWIGNFPDCLFWLVVIYFYLYSSLYIRIKYSQAIWFILYKSAN